MATIIRNSFSGFAPTWVSVFDSQTIPQDIKVLKEGFLQLRGSVEHLVSKTRTPYRVHTSLDDQ